jgi:hypothetical protein
VLRWRRHTPGPFQVAAALESSAAHTAGPSNTTLGIATARAIQDMSAVAASSGARTLATVNLDRDRSPVKKKNEL